jgi:hypothetical protein
MQVSYRIGGQVALSVDDPDDAERTFLASQMDPYAPVPDGAEVPHVRVAREPDGPALADIHYSAGDGVVTAADGERFYVLDDRDRRFGVPAPDAVPAVFTREPGFPLWRVYGAAIRPALHVAMLESDAVALHSASAVVDGAGVVVAGWSESGKTETALAMAEGGGRFLSDKWTILAPDGTVRIFPMRVGVRRWVLRYLPRIRDALPRAARGQMVAAGAVNGITKPLRRLAEGGRVSARGVGMAERVVALADRASLTLSDIATAYGHPADPDLAAPLRVLALLTNVPDGPVSAQPADPAWAARRLARTAAFERRELFSIHERARYVFADWADAAEASREREERLLVKALADVTVIEVRAPFPTDPRLTAEAALGSL